MINNPKWQETTIVGNLQSVVELNPGQPETNPDQRLLNRGNHIQTQHPQLKPLYTPGTHLPF